MEIGFCISFVSSSNEDHCRSLQICSDISNDKSVQVVNADRWQEDGHGYFVLIFVPRKKKYVK